MTRNSLNIFIDVDGHYPQQNVTNEQDQHISDEWQMQKIFLDSIADRKKSPEIKKVFEVKGYSVRCRLCNKADLVEKKQEIKTPYHFVTQEVTHVCPVCTAIKNKYWIAFNMSQNTCYQIIQVET